MSAPGFWSGIVACILIVILVLAFSYGTGRTIEVGDIKIGAIPEVEDPDMKRCKAAQAAVANYTRIFTDVRNALEIAMRDVQDKEIAARTLWADMSKNKPDDLWSQNSLINDINTYRTRYWSLENEVGDKLDYIGQRLDYIITECGLLPREQ